MNFPKVLFFHNNDGDYLTASLFHGLRTVLGGNCVDIPRYDCMYSPLPGRLKSRLRGGGFTLYGLLPDIPELAAERHYWQMEMDQYDYIVISDIWNLWQLSWKLIKAVDPAKLIILDGSDQPELFPNALHLMSQPWAYLMPVTKVKYFKRELIPGYSSHYLWQRSLKYLPIKRSLPARVRPIAFSIPEEKIWVDNAADNREKDFPTHIVDQEVAYEVNRSKSDKYTFTSENEYYYDMRRSRFGISPKRGGWDCLRHYELAANGCVLCVRDLYKKPSTCAPHGLDVTNSIMYTSYSDLKQQLLAMSEEEYCSKKQLTYDWIFQNTTRHRASEFLQACAMTRQ